MMFYVGLVLIIVGIMFIVSGIVLLFRLPDFYSKLHAASVIEICGIPFCLFGLLIIQDVYSFKICIIILLILLLNPVSTFALAKAYMKINN